MAQAESEPIWQDMGGGAAGGYAWQAGDKVAAYLHDQETPERMVEIQAAHQCMIDLLALETDAAFRFLDLGAGAGAVAGSVLTRFPQATGVLADISVPMMSAGARKLAVFGSRFRYVEYDMNADPWPPGLSGPFRAIVSARAIHHLSDERKGRLFRYAYNNLVPGGIFVNWDLFRHPEEPQKPTHPVATAEDQLDLLRRAGFVSVAPFHEQARYTVFYGRRV